MTSSSCLDPGLLCEVGQQTTSQRSKVQMYIKFLIFSMVAELAEE